MIESLLPSPKKKLCSSVFVFDWEHDNSINCWRILMNFFGRMGMWCMNGNSWLYFGGDPDRCQICKRNNVSLSQWCTGRPMTRMTGNKPENRSVLSIYHIIPTTKLTCSQRFKCIHNLLTGTLLLSTFIHKKVAEIKKKRQKRVFY